MIDCTLANIILHDYTIENENDITYQKLLCLFKNIINDTDYIIFCEKIDNKVMDKLTYVLSKIHIKNDELTKIIHDIILHTTIENKLIVLYDSYNNFSKKLIDTFNTYEEQNMIYEKIILHTHNNPLECMMNNILDNLVDKFMDMTYSMEIISQHKESPLNLYVKNMYNKIKQGFCYWNPYMVQLKRLVKLF
jgi:hypothetical protein